MGVVECFMKGNAVFAANPSLGTSIKNRESLQWKRTLISVQRV